MLYNIVGKYFKIMLLLLPLVVAGCNGGGSSSSIPTSSGSLIITNANSSSDVVLGGTHEYIISLVGSANLAKPVDVTVTSSNSYVASIESNNCATMHLAQTNSYASSCSFFVRGNNAGMANITVFSDNYPLLTESLNVSQQWGTFSGEVYYDGITLSAHQLTFNGSTIYALTDGVVVRSDGGPWQLIGGGKFITDDFSQEAVMASDSTSVCIALNYNHSVIRGEVKCSTNGSNWQTSALLDGWNISKITVYNNTVYALVYGFGFNFAVMSCPVNNCTSWQQVGQTFATASKPRGYAIYKASGFVENALGTYYLTDDGSWQLYGSYVSNAGVSLFVNSDGVALMPAEFSGETLLPYVQSVYYNSSNNIGSSFMPINGGIVVANFIGTGNDPLAINHNSIFAECDRNIFVSTNNSNIWSSWNKVGYNNPSLNNVYVNDDKVYSISYYSKNNISGSQIYVYSLD